MDGEEEEGAATEPPYAPNTGITSPPVVNNRF
jgi:hypothetical protein